MIPESYSNACELGWAMAAAHGDARIQHARSAFCAANTDQHFLTHAALYYMPTYLQAMPLPTSNASSRSKGSRADMILIGRLLWPSL